MILADDSHLVTASELAGRHGVTSQSVRNWMNAGMPAAGRTKAGAYLFDPSECGAWIRANRGGTAHGGKRRRAGRPRLHERTDRRMAERMDAARVRAEVGGRDGPPVGAMRAEDLLRVTHEEVRALAAVADEAGLTASQLQRLKTMIEVRAMERAEAERAGKLVDAERVREAFERRLRGAVRRLEAVPDRVADAVLNALGSRGVPTAGLDPVVREAAMDEVIAAVNEAAGERAAE